VEEPAYPTAWGMQALFAMSPGTKKPAVRSAGWYFFTKSGQ
jgi:hypothetical protein